MSIDDFETWFGVQKITSGKGEEMEQLKPIFQECWENCKGIVDEEVTEIASTNYDLEVENESLLDEIETLKGAMIELKNIVYESKTLKQCRKDVDEYHY